jgi:peptidylprolyl isomerase
MRSRKLILLTPLILLVAGCKSDSAAGRAAETIRTVFSPAPLPPDTIPEMLHYAADLQVNVSEMGRLPEGVLWIDLAPGDGAAAGTGDSVEVAFWGWLPDGTLVDSGVSALRVGQGQVIEGLDLGISGMKPGGRRQLVLPPGLAYGTEGSDNIPPNSVLVYFVDLRAKVP